MSGNTYITNGTTQDGFGARMHRAIHTMAFTFYLRDKFSVNIEYIHTPFSYEGLGERFDLLESGRALACAHPNGDPYNEVRRDGYLKRAILWDENMNYFGKIITDVEVEIININDADYGKKILFNDISNDNINNKLYVIKYLQNEFNNGHFDINMVDRYYDEISDKFRIPKDNNNNIILQIRRKDAFKYGTTRYLEDEYYLDILKQLEPYKDEYNISIHTQRSGFNESKFLDWNVIYDDEEEDYDLFKRMTSSKVLVVGKTSFSVAASFLNKNIVVYPPMNAKPLSRYISKDNLINKLKNIK